VFRNASSDCGRLTVASLCAEFEPIDPGTINNHRRCRSSDARDFAIKENGDGLTARHSWGTRSVPAKVSRNR
jgi:hypothetical protein